MKQFPYRIVKTRTSMFNTTSHLYDETKIREYACTKYGIMKDSELDAFLQSKTEMKQKKRQERITKKESTIANRRLAMEQALMDHGLPYDTELCDKFFQGKYKNDSTELLVIAYREKTEQERQRQQRKVRLESALAMYGLKLRADSQLCQHYINDDFDTDDYTWTLTSIVRRMCQMKYLYEYCHMQEIRDKVYREHRDYYDAVNGVEVSEEAERRALAQYSNRRYPDVFPWMKSQATL